MSVYFVLAEVPGLEVQVRGGGLAGGLFHSVRVVAGDEERMHSLQCRVVDEGGHGGRRRNG